jgi:hypothetical protein
MSEQVSDSAVIDNTDASRFELGADGWLAELVYRIRGDRLVFAVLIARYVGKRQACSFPRGGGRLGSCSRESATSAGIADSSLSGNRRAAECTSASASCRRWPKGCPLAVVGGCLAVAARNRSLPPLALACGVNYRSAAFLASS